MRIISVNPYVIRGAHPSSSTQDPNWGYSCLVRIETDTGLVGWGEGTTDLGWGAPKLLERINTMFAPTLIGRDPTEPMAIWKDLQTLSVSNYGRELWTSDEQQTSIGAISAIDIALWDITGNAKGQPICKQLSSAIRSHIKVCVEVSLDDLWVQQFSSDSPWQLASATIPEAQSLLDLGFDTFQVKIEGRPESDMQVVRATREAFGRHASIVVENYNLNAPGEELVWAMSSARISLFVEAFKPHSKDNLRPSVPVAWGENEWDGKKLCEGMAGGGVDILRPNIIICGGFTALLRIMIIAKSHDVLVMPSCSSLHGSGIALAAIIQASAAVP
ncbi:Mandelate racemase/muconate lactonizing enzyme [Penicillium expansum]|nr:Mandelate racemase/muconate lactonizing enzyme [Penicillium expansum]